MDKQVVISIKTVLLAVLFVVLSYALYKLGPIIGILAIAVLIVISLESLVKYMMKGTLLNKPVSRGFAVVASYSIVLVFLATVVTLGIPPVVSQTQKLLTSLSDIAIKLNISKSVDLKLVDLLPQATNISNNFLSLTVSIFSNVAAIISVLIISIYMSLDWENIKRRVFALFPESMRDEAKETVLEIETNIGHWIKGELTLMFVVGLGCYLGLLLLGVRYPLALGLVSGVLEVVPMMGPVLSAVLAGIIGFADAPIKGVGVVILYFVVQQLENNLLVPKIMQKASGFSPLTILIALLVGSKFFGILGAIVAVPVMIIGTIALRKIFKLSR